MTPLSTSDSSSPSIAYFSMEVGLDASLPTYSGGLGVLAGDTLKAAADLGLPMVGVTLLHRKGYFRQRLDAMGNQTEQEVQWRPEDALEPVGEKVAIVLGGHEVGLRAWRYVIDGVSGGRVPVYFLDTSLPENSPAERALTDHLYGGDSRYRLSQEAVLGLGGVAMLRALGHDAIETFHMNEGHSALLTLALLEERADGRSLATVARADREAVGAHCVFTTHTPVPAGHDQFEMGLVRDVLGGERTEALVDTGSCVDGRLNMTYLALSFSRFINGVAMRHGQISQDMFPSYPINSITNGVHAVSWASAPVATLFDEYIPGWRKESLNLRYAVGIPLDEIRKAHAQAKRDLIDDVRARTGVSLDPEVLTIGFARRATAYKRADLVFSDLDRLKRIVKRSGPMQIIYGGKAHPNDSGGKDLIRRVFEMSAELRKVLPVVYLEEYDMAVGKLLCSGVDVWLNTPQKPQEASGTSGMKAALNGVPSLSVRDGWWIEGHVEDVTGWAIGKNWRHETDPIEECASLYHKLENSILPLYYKKPRGFARVRRSSIALNASFFNAQRMLLQYVDHAYQ